MSTITQDDIQHIRDEDTLLHFLQEKLNLPIPERTTLAQIALPLPLPFLGLDDLITEQIIDCQDFRGLPQDALDERRPFLIRFRCEPCSSDILREVADGLAKRNINPAEVCFICADENFQPFAFAYFNDSTSADWYTAGLTVFSWTRKNTHINAGPEHDLSDLFFSEESLIEPDDTSEIKRGFSNNEGESNLSENLLIKLRNTGIPLSQYLKRHGDIHTGITPGYTAAFVIDGFKREELLNEDPKSSELIKEFLKPRKWTGELAYLICIPSSKNKRWPWSGTRNNLEAEWIFKETYPAISNHMEYYRTELEARECFKTGSAVFYWEFPAYGFYSVLEHPKIFYPPTASSMRAAYDTSGKLLLSAAFFRIKDISLLATLNSKLFAWYIYQECWEPQPKHLGLKKTKMKKIPIPQGTETQKDKLSNLVQQILDDPYNFAVPDIEQEIDKVVYELYELTPAEINLIEEESSK